MGATMVVLAHVDLDDVCRRVSVVPLNMDVAARVQIVVHCGHDCDFYADSPEQAAEFLTLAVKQRQQELREEARASAVSAVLGVGATADVVDPHV